jgi:hypothetical protein
MPHFSPKIRFLSAMIIVIVISGAIAYWRAYSSITPYYDEGTMMLTVRQVENGAALYNQVISIYGPVYYLCEALPYMLSGARVSHDSVRMITTILRVAAGLVFFSCIVRPALWSGPWRRITLAFGPSLSWAWKPRTPRRSAFCCYWPCPWLPALVEGLR